MEVNVLNVFNVLVNMHFRHSADVYVVSTCTFIVPIMEDSNFRVSSWNMNGLNNPVKRSRVMTKMRKEKKQIIFLQETHLSHSEHEKFRKFGYEITFHSSFKTGHKRGVAILLHNSY